MKLKVNNFIFLTKTPCQALRKSNKEKIMNFEKPLKLMRHGKDAQSWQHVSLI